MGAEIDPTVSRATLDRELGRLKSQVLDMGDRVERAIQRSLEALAKGDRSLAERIVAEDAEVNDLRFQVERTSLEVIATQQPAARDLREIVAAMNIVVDLERMGDHATGIAKTLLGGDRATPAELPADLKELSEAVRSMLRQALHAYDRRSADLAYEAALQDDLIDDLYQVLFRRLLEQMVEQPAMSNELLAFQFAGHNLERVADRVTNISERVIFMVSGQMQELNPEPDDASLL